MNIYVTGAGVISAIGNNYIENLQSLLNKQSGIAPLQYLKTIYHNMPSGEIKASSQQLANLAATNNSQPLVRTPLLGIIAAKEAIQNAKAQNIDNKAIVSGTTVGGMDIMEQNYDDFTHNSSKNHLLYPHDIGDSTQYIADQIGGFTFATSISTACSSAANAIILAAELIKSKRYDIVVAGGAESLSLYHFNGFNTLKVLDNAPCRPFCNTRAGLNLGEGAGYIVLESENSVKKRGISPLCKLSGYANTCDAYHQTATSSNGEGPYLAMQQALQQANLLPSQISYINAHGTATQNNDLTESIAIKRLFGNSIPLLSSTKSFTGHTTSAAGGIEAVFAIMCIANSFCPANLNFSTPIPETNIIPTTQTTKTEINHVITNSFGFGGNDTTLIFSKV